MKAIIAVIRNERAGATMTALQELGIHAGIFTHVTGRGSQKGRISSREIGESLNRNMRMQLTMAPEPGSDGKDDDRSPDRLGPSGFLPKCMLLLVVADNELSRVVQAIVDVNQSGRHGDGRIFICPMISAVRVGTGEQGDRALS